MPFRISGFDTLITKLTNLRELLALAGTGKVRVESNAPYVDVVIHGSRPHVILPVNALALTNHEDFGPVAMVNHPGTRPNDFPTRARNKARPLIVREYMSMIGGGLYLGAVRAEAAKIAVGKTLLAAVKEEAPKDTGNLAKGLRLVGSLGDLL